MQRLTFILCLLTTSLFGTVQDVDYSLYFVTWRGDLPKEWMSGVIEEAVIGGVTIVQIDERDTPFDECVAFAKDLVALLAPYNVPLLINSRVDVAKASGAQGVHFLSYDPVQLKQARKALGPKAIIGFSASSKNRILAMDGIENDTVADYISMGPVFPSKSYPNLKPWGLEGLAHAKTLTEKPLLAVGGVRLSNVAEAIAGGADGIVIVSSIQDADDPRRAAKELMKEIQSVR